MTACRGASSPCGCRSPKAVRGRHEQHAQLERRARGNPDIGSGRPEVQAQQPAGRVIGVTGRLDHAPKARCLEHAREARVRLARAPARAARIDSVRLEPDRTLCPRVLDHPAGRRLRGTARYPGRTLKQAINHAINHTGRSSTVEMERLRARRRIELRGSKPYQPTARAPR